jgi:DNA-binding response OmpR family regulator
MPESKAKILIIEDDKMLSDMYSLKFNEEGYQAIQAFTGLEGVEKTKTEKPDIILLDIILPQMDGFQVMEEIKKNKELENIPILFLTNLRQEEDVKKGTAMGAVGYLVKASFTPAQVLDKVKEILKQYKK